MECNLNLSMHVTCCLPSFYPFMVNGYVVMLWCFMNPIDVLNIPKTNVLGELKIFAFSTREEICT